MCGRFVATASPTRIAEWLRAEVPDDVTAAPPRYNVAPTSDILAVAAHREGRRIGWYHWGLIPRWARDRSIGQRMINARAETLAEKRSFSGPLAASRCVVPMDGFYEWRAGGPGEGARRIPHYLQRADGDLLAVAALWTSWRNPEGPAEPIESVTLVTCAASSDVARVHHRMPALLTGDALDVWLDPDERDPVLLTSLLTSAPEGTLSITRVSTRVNSARNEGPDLIVPESPA